MVFIFIALSILQLSFHQVSAYTPHNLLVSPTQLLSNNPPCITYQPITLFFPEGVSRLFSCKREANEILEEIGKEPENYVVLFDYATGNVRNIIVEEVTRTRIITWQKIAFPIEITYTKSLPHRKKVIDKRGGTGLKGTITEKMVYKDGTTKTKTIAKWLERETRTEYVRVGTKYDLQQKVIDGKTVSYWGTLLVKATSYDHSCYGCNDITATGAKLTKGIVAVDPKVISMHTQMYIPGYGFGKAEDTGGMIKGNRIDLAYDDIRYGDWSKRWVTIYLID